MNAVRFAHPLFLWLALLALPALALFLIWAWRTKQKLMTQFVTARLLPGLTIGVSVSRYKLRCALLLAAAAMILITLARPQWGFVWEESHQQGLDIVVAIDTSRSMLAADLAPNRLTRAKLGALDLMRLAKNDRLGLVAFAGSAFLQAPLTLDEEAFRQNVEALDVTIIPQGGTALREAINTALTAFEKGSDNHKVLVIFTDGEDHDQDSETLAAAEAAAKEGLKIFTIGVGTAEGDLVKTRDEQGNQVYVKDDDGNVVKSHLNEALLQKAATVAGGFYLPLRAANAIDTLYKRGLAPLPKSDSATKLTKTHKERYHWFLALAISCLLIEMFLPDARRKGTSSRTGLLPVQENGTGGAMSVSDPAAKKDPARAQQPVTAQPPVIQSAGTDKIAVVLFLIIPAIAYGSPSGALKQYRAGDYGKAQSEYERLAGQKTNDYRLRYNAGTAAYKAKRFETARKHLDATLNASEITSDLDTQQKAYYNLGNTLFQLGAPVDDMEKKQELWEESIDNYTRALRLNPTDKDATNNLVFVQKQLERLKQQQQQSQKDKNNKDDKKDDKKDQQDQQQNESNKDKQDKNDQNQQQQPKQDQKDKKEQQQSEKEKQQQEQAKKDQEKKQEQEKQQASAQNKSDKKSGETNQQAVAVGQMTPEQAKQFLDAIQQEEKALIFMPEEQPRKQLNRKIKDW